MEEQTKQEQQVGIRIDPELWHEFKMACMRQRRAAKDVIADLMQDYIQTRQGAEEVKGERSTTKERET